MLSSTACFVFSQQFTWINCMFWSFNAGGERASPSITGKRWGREEQNWVTDGGGNKGFNKRWSGWWDWKIHTMLEVMEWAQRWMDVSVNQRIRWMWDKRDERVKDENIQRFVLSYSVTISEGCPHNSAFRHFRQNKRTFLNRNEKYRSSSSVAHYWNKVDHIWVQNIFSMIFSTIGLNET